MPRPFSSTSYNLSLLESKKTMWLCTVSLLRIQFLGVEKLTGYNRYELNFFATLLPCNSCATTATVSLHHHETHPLSPKPHARLVTSGSRICVALELYQTIEVKSKRELKVNVTWAATRCLLLVFSTFRLPKPSGETEERDTGHLAGRNFTKPDATLLSAVSQCLRVVRCVRLVDQSGAVAEQAALEKSNRA